jgi:alkanesulfonate monooxygenase SsuD/methylene tetrahydromethanopterin reductase-like flavin-dependent oxidoreductase (luciferase family)
MRIGFKTVQSDTSWERLLELWELGDEIEVFDSAWLNDHFGRDTSGYHEAMVIAAALASRTRRLIFGHTVLGNTHRHPALLAKMAATVDHIAPGRFIVGIGAGWNEFEHEMYGWELPPIGLRMDMLDEAIQILRGMWANPDGFTFHGRFYQLENARCDPACPTPGGPAIWVGTSGKVRGLRILAERGDGWAGRSVGWEPGGEGNLAEFQDLVQSLLRHCDEVGRDPSAIEVSVRISVSSKKPADLLREASALVASGADHLVFSLPSRSGPAELEHLARSVANPLRAEFG